MSWVETNKNKLQCSTPDNIKRTSFDQFQYLTGEMRINGVFQCCMFAQLQNRDHLQCDEKFLNRLSKWNFHIGRVWRCFYLFAVNSV